MKKFRIGTLDRSLRLIEDTPALVANLSISEDGLEISLRFPEDDYPNHPHLSRIMTQPKASLPLIDISPFLSPSTDAAALQQCTRALSEACLHHGFFYLTNHGIDAKLTDNVLSLARDFFTKRTDAEKQSIERQDVGKGLGDGARGYQVIGDNVTQGKRDWHEAVDWYRPIIAGEGSSGQGLSNATSQSSNGTENEDDKGQSHRTPPYPLLRGVNRWPAHPPAFRAIYEEYIAKMLHLGTAVVRAMGYALQLKDPETFVKATSESFWVMRAIGYPPVREDEGDVLSCGPHTDYGCLTLLLADGTEGALQVRSSNVSASPKSSTTNSVNDADHDANADNKDNDDERWINANPIPGALVVNIGDMMERWTNGLWKSTLHKVVHKGEGIRVSVPFFFEPDFEARVRPLGECVGVTGGVERYREVVYGEHLVGKVGGNFYAGADE